MREILVTELHSNFDTAVSDNPDAFDNGDHAKKDELKNSNEAIFDEIEYLVENTNYNGTNLNRLRDKRDAIDKLIEFRTLIVSVRKLIDITNSVNLAPLIKHYVDLGINPGGNDISLQSRLLNGNFVHLVRPY